MSGPFSSYSSLDIHMEGITGSEPRIEPPSHAACLRSGIASTWAHWVAAWAHRAASRVQKAAAWAHRAAHLGLGVRRSEGHELFAQSLLQPGE